MIKISQRLWPICYPKITSRRRPAWLHALRRIASKERSPNSGELNSDGGLVHDRDPTDGTSGGRGGQLIVEHRLGGAFTTRTRSRSPGSSGTTTRALGASPTLG